MSDLPAGWEWTTIGEVAATSLGKMLDKKQATGMHPTPYLRNINVRWGSFDLSDLAEMDIRPDELDRVLAQRGDVIACEGGEPGRAAVWNGPGTIALQKALHRIQPTEAILPAYVALLLQHLAMSRQLERFFTGTTIKHLPQEKLRLVKVPLPPRTEQDRIVAAVDEHLSHLEAAESVMASARARLLRLRSSVLECVTAGDWVARPLGELLLSLRNGCFVSRPKVDPPGLPILRISAVRPLALDASDVRYAPGHLERSMHYKVEGGDLLFTRYSGNPDYVGACAVVPISAAGILHPDKLIRGVPDPALVLGGWVALLLSSSRGRREIEQRLKTTAGQVGISGSQLRTVPIPLPPLPTQSERITAWLAATGAMMRLHRELGMAVARAVAARRAILAAAFSGRLVPQDPDDEPASVLLERFRAQRAVASPTRRTRTGEAAR